jgi:hypothetical protein
LPIARNATETPRKAPIASKNPATGCVYRTDTLYLEEAVEHSHDPPDPSSQQAQRLYGTTPRLSCSTSAVDRGRSYMATSSSTPTSCLSEPSQRPI